MVSFDYGRLGLLVTRSTVLEEVDRRYITRLWRDGGASREPVSGVYRMYIHSNSGAMSFDAISFSPSSKIVLLATLSIHVQRS